MRAQTPEVEAIVWHTPNKPLQVKMLHARPRDRFAAGCLIVCFFNTQIHLIMQTLWALTVTVCYLLYLKNQAMECYYSRQRAVFGRISLDSNCYWIRNVLRALSAHREGRSTVRLLRRKQAMQLIPRDQQRLNGKYQDRGQGTSKMQSAHLCVHVLS